MEEKNEIKINNIRNIKNKEDVLMLLEKENEDELNNYKLKINNLKSIFINKIDDLSNNEIERIKLELNKIEQIKLELNNRIEQIKFKRNKDIEFIELNLKEFDSETKINNERKNKLIHICFDKYSSLHDKEITEEYLSKYKNLPEKSETESSHSFKSHGSYKSKKSNEPIDVSRKNKEIAEEYLEKYAKTEINIERKIIDKIIVYENENGKICRETLFNNLIESLFSNTKTHKNFMIQLDDNEKEFRNGFRPYLKAKKVTIIKDDE